MKWHVLIPTILGTICLVGIIVLSIMQLEIPEVLITLTIAFGGWAFGAGSIAAKDAVQVPPKNGNTHD